MRIHECSTRIQGPAHRRTLIILNGLGRLYRDQGRLEEAEQTLMRALDIHREAYGVEHHTTLSVMQNLAAVYADRGRANEAVGLMENVARVYRTEFGLADLNTLTALTELCRAYIDSNRYAEAENACKEALEGFATHHDQNPELQTALANLANAAN